MIQQILLENKQGHIQYNKLKTPYIINIIVILNTSLRPNHQFISIRLLSVLYRIYALTQLLQLLHPQLLAFAHQLFIRQKSHNADCEERDPKIRKCNSCIFLSEQEKYLTLTSISLVISCTFSLFFSLKASRASLYSLSCDIHCHKSSQDATIAPKKKKTNKHVQSIASIKRFH